MSDKKKKFTGKAKKRGFLAGLISLGVLEIVFRPLIGLLGLFPLLDLDGLAHLLILAVSAGVGFIAAAMNTEMDLTPHNDKKQQRMEQEMESLGHSGDEAADSVIQKGQEMLRQIRAENAAIPDPTLTHQMYELEYQCLQIFKTVQQDPKKAPQIRKFMNYYLPTTLKMLANYHTMQDRGVSQKDLGEARDALIHGMNMILTVGQKQLDNLFKGDMLDISTDIDVLEQMLKRDGLTAGDLELAAQQARAAAQLDQDIQKKYEARKAAAPTMNAQTHAAPQDPQAHIPTAPTLDGQGYTAGARQTMRRPQ